jgi:hypothetical protein
MALGPEFDQPVGRSFKRIDDAVSRGQDRLFRVLWFAVPPESVARDVHFQALMASRFLADLALQALYFAALIASARAGDSALRAAAIGVAFLLPGVILGPWGGSVADALPKRLALAGAYVTMGILALLVPLTTGTGFLAMLAVLFLVRVLHQVSQPAEAAAAPLVASHAELASANSFLSLASSAGEVTGKALLAPALVRFWGLRPVTVIAGLMFMLSALRVVRFRPESDGQPFDRTRVRRLGVIEAVRWLMEEPGAFWMLLLAAMASTVNIVLATLGPQYVKQVLDVDPTFTFYVFAPASLGVVGGLLLAPLAIRLAGERRVAVAGFTIVSIATAAMGQVSRVSDWFGWALLIDIPRVSEEVEMAAAISLVVGAGITVAAAATQTYIGRYVPVAIHGRVFALLGALKDGLAIPQLLLLGALSGAVGVSSVITLAPLALLAIAYGVARASMAWHGRQPRSRLIG